MLSHLAQTNNQSYGLPAEITNTVGTFLYQAISNMKTGMGVSKTRYKHTRDLEVRGTCQESVASMYIWGMIVSQLIQLNDMYNHGTKYHNYKTRKEIIIGMLSFVNDCNFSTNGEQYEILKDILK